MGVSPTVDGFVHGHSLHHQSKYIEHIVSNDKQVHEDAQFVCTNFRYKTNVPIPVVASMNRWPDDWNQFWFYAPIPVIGIRNLHHLFVVTLAIFLLP